MTLNNQITADTDDVFFNTDEFAEEIIYTPVGGYDEEIEAISLGGENLQPYIRGPNTAVCEKLVKVSQVPDPQHGDRFTITSAAGRDEVWEFLHTYDENPNTRVVVLERELEAP